MTKIARVSHEAEMVSLAMNRRHFMLAAGGLSFGFAVDGLSNSARASANEARLSAWATLGSDGTLTIMSAAAELGQGSRTHLPLVLAEEMDVAWEKVRIVSAPPNTKVYGNPTMGAAAPMYTAAARTMSGYFPVMRMFGAQARRVLLLNVARKWNVPLEELRTEPCVVVHDKTKRRMEYGDIVAFLELPETAPIIEKTELKRPETFRYLGKRDIRRVDVAPKSMGAAQYSIDVKLEGMLYAAVLRAPVEGAKPESVDDFAARKIRGVSDIVVLPYGVGVIAANSWAAFRGRDALNVIWTRDGKGWNYDSIAMVADYEKRARDVNAGGFLVDGAKGDTKAALAAASKTHDATYVTAPAYHAQMEPLNATAHVSASGDAAEIWVGTQSQTYAVESAATALGTTPDKIILHDMMVGGGYGRRGHREHEYLTDALLLSRATKRPVKVTWKREDDMRNGRFRPLTVSHMRAGTDETGKITAWHHRVAADACLSFQDPVRFKEAKGRDAQLSSGAEVSGFNVPSQMAEILAIDNGLRTSAFRGISNGPNKFAIDSFMDELARGQGADPVAFRLKLLEGDKRAVSVIEATLAFSNWTKKVPGRGRGFTFIDYHDTYICAVADVSVDRQTGQVTVHNIWAMLHPGFAVQPDNIKNQMEGGIVFALGGALTEEIRVSKGMVQETNFDSYLVPRMDALPNIHVDVMSDPAMAPLGIGEQTVVSVAPVISNAIADATGKRVRHLPMTPEVVLAALRA